MYKITQWTQHFRSLISLCGEEKRTKRAICSNGKSETLRDYRHGNNKTQILTQINAMKNLFTFICFINISCICKRRNYPFLCVPEPKYK